MRDFNYPEQIALYLNLATAQIRANAGSLDRLVTGATAIPDTTAGDCQETQCLLVEDTLWVANNDDGDTQIQQVLVKKLGVRNYQTLADYVGAYQTRVLTKNGTSITLGSLTSKDRLLCKLAGQEEGVAPVLVEKPAVATEEFTPLAYRLSSSNDLPRPTGRSKIVFVTGAYEGVNAQHTKFHAEQKLLAALSTCYGRAFSKSVRIFGCKMACSTCKSVLDAVKDRLARTGVALRYTNESVDTMRSDVGLNRVTTSDIRALDVDTYFP
jgi:hypothetical protein